MIRKIARSIREYWWAALLSPLCMVGEVTMEVLIPRVMANLYDYGIELQDMHIIVTRSIQLVICAVMSLAFGVLSAIFASRAGTGFAKNLRHDMFYRVQTFSFGNIDKFSSASIVTRLTSDVANLQMTFQMLIRMAIRCPMMLILALVCLVPMVFKIFDKGFKMLDKLNNVVQENVHGIRVVKSFVREEKENKKFTDISGDLERTFSKAEKILALNSPIMMFCVYSCMLAISWFGAQMVVASGNNPLNGLTTGNLSAQKHILGDEQPLTGCFADTLAPIVEPTRKELEGVARSDEDVLSYIAFPSLAEKFFEARKAKEENECTYTIVEC